MLASKPAYLALAFLAGALPRPPHGQWRNQESDCDDETTSYLPGTVLTGTTIPTGNAQGPTSVKNAVDPSAWGPWTGAPVTSASTKASSATSAPPISTPATPANGSPGISQSSGSQYTSEITFADPNLEVVTVTITDLPSSQTPTATNATKSAPDTSGSVITSLETGGNPPVQPFPTSVPTVSQSTLQPSDTNVPTNTTIPASSAVSQTLTVPLSTFETVVVTSTVTNIPVPTKVTLTAITGFNTTYTSDGSTITKVSAGTTVVITTATGLTPTTVEASSTITGTVEVTLTTGGPLTNLPTATNSPSCTFSLGCSGQDVFKAIGVGIPPSNIERRSGHPVPRLGISNGDAPIGTNKFYSNFFLGTQGSPVFVMPYSLTWSKGSGNAQSWGMSITHTEDSQKIYGPPNSNIPNRPNSFYINPLGIQSLILSAAEFGSSTVLTTDSLQAFSANAHLAPVAGSNSYLTIPIVQGMAFVTGQYRSLQPAIQSSVFFRNIAEIPISRSGIVKYRLTLEDDRVWLIYAIGNSGISPNLQLVSSTLLRGISSWSGDIQIAKLPANVSESVYDNAAGVYPTTGAVAGYSQGSKAQYSLSWTKGGVYANNSTLLMFALPHHLESFDSTTRSHVTSLVLDTTTKGRATAVSADCWILEENDLPTTMGFAPWRPGSSQNVTTLSAAALATIQNISAIEASQNMSAQTNLNSMYYSGKALSKFAVLVYTMHDLANQQSLAKAALTELKAAFATFTNNQQIFPLYYDTDWKGIVSSASYATGDPGIDFGNSYYNDHHFHYGYFIHAASIIGYLDPSWLAWNREFVNALVRNTANPSSLDQYFPIFRAFDWYHGHSWAKGLYESGDGKDQESSSEDAMFAYAIKMWGRTIGDSSMEARGNLMLSVLTRSLRNYFLMESSNTNQPASFISNKATGILFENKVDHVTYFGLNPEYIQGIHMLPLLPFSTRTRSQQFVAEEWATYFADGAFAQASNVQGGWKGILYANLAIINPTAAYNFFSQSNFDPTWIDGGASRTWYLTFSAMLGGAP